MKKYLLVVVCLIMAYVLGNYMYYHQGVYIDLHPDQPVTTMTKTDQEKLYLKDGDQWEVFNLKGVDLGSGEPGEWATDYSVDYETYFRWFGQIQDMGANCIRVYSVQADTFYDAYYDYNKDREEPLYLLHGVWVNDYIQNSKEDAYGYAKRFIDDCKIMIDVIHGNRNLELGTMASSGSGSYRKDISPWVLGYILGVNWEDVTVSFTNEQYKDDEKRNQYHGAYMFTDAKATPFEALLAKVGDETISYESHRYKEQRLLSFSNWSLTDPFEYPKEIAEYFLKCAQVDVEHIKCTDAYLSGQFASYHVNPCYPDYLNYLEDWSCFGDYKKADYYTEDGQLNSYRAYLQLLNDHHTMPVVIAECGVSTGRGIAYEDHNTNQGNKSETEQGEALVQCYRDIMETGSAGCCVFSWQDEWSRKTWNTMHAVDLSRIPYWSDYQTNDQYYGLLSFDPGKETCVSYVDGNLSEWTKTDVVSRTEDATLSVKYDERFLYLYIHKDGYDLEQDKLYIPIDVTQKSGSTTCEGTNLTFSDGADFLITLDGKDNSRIQVQERYNALLSTYSEELNGTSIYFEGNIPPADSDRFMNMEMILQVNAYLLKSDFNGKSESFETGKLIFGTANPSDADYNSLADFMVNGEEIELKLPWQLLNFSDPSRMQIHDDYFAEDHYGVEFMNLELFQLGVGNGQSMIQMNPVKLKGWGNDVTYHERLKPAYYKLQSEWTS